MPKYIKDGDTWKRQQTMWQKYYEESGDVRYAALAIGRAVAISEMKNGTFSPPGWALKACREFFEDFDKSHFDPLPTQKVGAPGYGTTDDELLDQMAFHTLRGETVNFAAKAVTGEDDHSPNVARLDKKWRKEWGKHPDRDQGKKTGNTYHPRELRLFRLKGHFLFPSQS